MKVITIGTDKKLFELQSVVLDRQIGYASQLEELHIVVFTRATDQCVVRKIKNLSIYPTHSSSKIMYLWDAYRIAKQIILDNQFVRGDSVVSSQDPFECGLVSHMLARKFTLPLQVQIHTDFFSPYFKHTFLNKLRKWISSYVIYRAHGVRVVSASIAQTLTERFVGLRARISILPIFIDIPKIMSAVSHTDLKTQFPQFKFIFFMASRLTKEKEILTALQAFAQTVQSLSNTKIGLVIAGTGPEESLLKLKVHEYGLDDLVVFIGWQDDLISYYKTADTFILTSRYEGYGMTLIEAGASGCPIISTPVGIAQTICENGKNSFVCPIGDVRCFARCMHEMVSVNSWRKLFKIAMQDSISGLSMSQEAHTSLYVHILQEIATPHTS